MQISNLPGRRAVLRGGLFGASAVVLAACSGSGTSDRPTIVTGCYPLAYLASAIGGDAVETVNLAKPGVDPHGLELSVAEVAQVTEADLVIAIPHFQAAIDDALAKHGADNALQVSDVVTMLSADPHHAEEHDDDHGDDEHDEHEHGAEDPHFWHDPQRMAKLAAAVGKKLQELAPDRADGIRERTGTLTDTLDQLDHDLTESFGAVDGPKPFVTSHTAFAYLADRYHLEQVGITGVDPEVEPSPRRLLEIEKTIREQDVTTVFFESTASPKVAETLADNVGVSTSELDNLETQLDPEKDYPAVMRENAEKLVKSWS